MDRTKRHRSNSASSQSSAASTSSFTSSAASPSTKQSRSTSSTLPSPSCTCHLPPTCHHTPTTFRTPSLLAAHQATFHSLVCRATVFSRSYESPVARARDEGQERAECGRVFPDERTFECHQREVHDALAQVRQERGEKIFACLSPLCSTYFHTPKARRLHLIDKHHYPKEYFFGVTLHGVEDVLRKPGGGMLRGAWKAREEAPATARDDGEKEKLQAWEGEREREKEKEQESREEEKRMEALTEGLRVSSIGLVPRAVRQKQKSKGKGDGMQL